MRKCKRTSWWQVYAIVIGAALLLWWEGREHLAEPLNEIALLGIVLLVHGLIFWWLQANRVALEREQKNSSIRWLSLCLLGPAALFGASCAGLEASPVPAQTPPAEIATEALLHYGVVSADGQPLGPVDGVVLHVDTGRAEYVVVLLPDKYHFGKGAYGPPDDKFLLIPWSHLNLDAANQVLVVDVDATTLTHAPVLNRVPNTSPANWDTTIAQYWEAR